MKIGAAYGKLLSGESVIREFLTIGIGDQIREKVYLQMVDRVLDVSGNHWLLGLDPRVVGIWIEKKESGENLKARAPYTLYFRDSAPTGNEGIARNALGVLRMEYVNEIVENNGTLFLFNVLASSIHHIDFLRARLLYQKFYKKPGVSFERLKAVAAAYTYPRRVRIISFRFDEANNYIFPMDLLADIRSSGKYLLGMRHSNQVLKRIMDVKKIVVAEAPARYKGVIYQLGRNHSASPPSVDQLPFGVIRTRQFGFCLPEWVESYKEISIGKTLDLGSHMLLCGDWVQDEILQPPTPRLHHIHFLHFLHQKGKRLTYPIVQ
ncbi:MAG TPA: hypothetical protein VG052_05030 [Puia sp.]|jgi:hypothetical protein|nr:hypothetical protein [Puia sp.]